MDSIPIDAIHAYHSKERQLFSRMIFILGMEPVLSMEIIAFWLWLEENGHSDIIRSIDSLDDGSLLDVASVGKTFVESLHLNSLSGNRISSIEGNANQHFRKVAMCGISYYLSSVCHKALADILQKVETETNVHGMETSIKETSQIHLGCTNMNDHNLRSGKMGLFESENSLTNLTGDACKVMPEISYHRDHGSQCMLPASSKTCAPSCEGTISSDSRMRKENSDVHNKGTAPTLRKMQRNQPLNNVRENDFGMHQVLYVESSSQHVFNLSQSPINQKSASANNISLCKHSFPHYSLMEDASSSSNSTGLSLVPHCTIPHDERTLFVTFSNGFPLTEDELHTFFMRHYGDVEMVSVQESIDGKPPLYAHVTFYSLATLLRILNGNVKVKFMTKGRHLWVRRFIPKKKFKHDE